MAFPTCGQNLLVLHERHSRLLLAQILPSRQAHEVATRIAGILGLLPPPLRKTLTFDNGSEFAGHARLHALAIATSFCDPCAPWQKGGIENAIGRLRRSLPRRTDLATLTPERLAACIARYNNIPRKCIDFRSPAEVFSTLMLHFKRETTSTHKREGQGKAGLTGQVLAGSAGQGEPAPHGEGNGLRRTNRRREPAADPA